MNIDAIIYTNNIIADLENDGAFDPEVDCFLEKDNLHTEILKFAEQNIVEHDNPMLTETQLLDAFKFARQTAISETMEDMIMRGMMTIEGVTENGEFTYGIAPHLKKVFPNPLSN